MATSKNTKRYDLNYAVNYMLDSDNSDIDSSQGGLDSDVEDWMTCWWVMAQIMTKRKFVFDVCFSFGRAQFLESFKPLLKCLLIHNQKHMYLFLFLAGILGIMLKPKVFLYNNF